MGRKENSNTIYLIDYGLAKRFRDSTTRTHIPYKQNKRLSGTTRYASLNAHMGIEQSRRDDLECLGYTLIFMAKGELPWKGMKAETKENKRDKIRCMKKAISPEHLCQGLPSVFANFMHYCRSLKFEDKPDYAALKKNFLDIYVKEKYYKGFKYDWINLNVDLEQLFDYENCDTPTNKAQGERKESIAEGGEAGGLCKTPALLSPKMVKKFTIQKKHVFKQKLSESLYKMASVGPHDGSISLL